MKKLGEMGAPPQLEVAKDGVTNKDLPTLSFPINDDQIPGSAEQDINTAHEMASMMDESYKKRLFGLIKPSQEKIDDGVRAAEQKVREEGVTMFLKDLPPDVHEIADRTVSQNCNDIETGSIQSARKIEDKGNQRVRYVIEAKISERLRRGGKYGHHPREVTITIAVEQGYVVDYKVSGAFALKDVYVRRKNAVGQVSEFKAIDPPTGDVSFVHRQIQSGAEFQWRGDMKVSIRQEGWGAKRIIEEAQQGGVTPQDLKQRLSSNIQMIGYGMQGHPRLMELMSELNDQLDHLPVDSSGKTTDLSTLIKWTEKLDEVIRRTPASS